MSDTEPPGAQHDGTPITIIQLSSAQALPRMTRVLDLVNTGQVFAVHRSIDEANCHNLHVVFTTSRVPFHFSQPHKHPTGSKRKHVAIDNTMDIDGQSISVLFGADIKFLERHGYRRGVKAHGLTRSVIIWKSKKKLYRSSAILSAQSVVRTNLDRTLHIWSDGFSFDDGPRRPYNAMNNMLFLSNICMGEAPPEMFGPLLGDRVDVELIPHNVNYVPQGTRIPGLSSDAENKLARLFGELDTVQDSLVRVQRLHEHADPSYYGLLVEFTSVVEAAQTVDRLASTAKQCIFEFVRDPNATIPLGYKGPVATQPPRATWRTPTSELPQFVRDLKIGTSRMRYIANRVIGKDRALFWEKMIRAFNQEQDAHKLTEDERREHTGGSTSSYRRGDWVCGDCGQYCFANHLTTCANEECKKHRLSNLDTVYPIVHEGTGLSEDEADEEKGSYFEGKIVFWSWPDEKRVEEAKRTPKLPLMRLFD